MQLILKRPPSSTQISSPTSGSEAPHKYRQHHKLPQKYLQSTSRRTQRKLNSSMMLKLGRFGQQIRNTWKVLKCGAVEGWRRSF